MFKISAWYSQGGGCNKDGVLIENFENPYEVPRSYLVGVAWNYFLEIFFHP